MDIGNVVIVSQLMKYNFDFDYVCQRNKGTTLMMALKEKKFDQHLLLISHKLGLCICFAILKHSVAMMYAIGREFRKIVEYLVYECMYLMQ